MTTETPMLSQIDQMFRSSNFVPVERVSITRKQWDQLKAEMRGKDSQDLLEALEVARNRIKDMLCGDDGQAWKEATKALPKIESAITKAGGK